MINIRTVTDLEDVTIVFYENPQCIVRTTEVVAYQLLLNNSSRVYNGVGYYFNITHIGLNVYELRLIQAGILNATMLNAYNE